MYIQAERIVSLCVSPDTYFIFLQHTFGSQLCFWKTLLASNYLKMPKEMTWNIIFEQLCTATCICFSNLSHEFQFCGNGQNVPVSQSMKKTHYVQSPLLSSESKSVRQPCCEWVTLWVSHLAVTFSGLELTLFIPWKSAIFNIISLS